MTNYKEIITTNFCFKGFDIFNPEHQNIKDILKEFKGTSEISSNLDNFIINNL